MSPSRLNKERKLVEYICEFMGARHNRRPLNSNEMINEINSFATSKYPDNVDEQIALNNALIMQHNALSQSLPVATNQPVIHVHHMHSDPWLLYPMFPYGPGYYNRGWGWGGGGCGGPHHGGGGSSSADEGALVILGVALAGSVLAAAYGLSNDLFEVNRELYNAQRIPANMATLALGSAYIAAATVAILSICATNPVGWAFFAGSAIVIGVALLVKMTRAIVNQIDASLSNSSGLASDSRFQLTQKEETKLLSQFSKDDIVKIKAIITGLAVRVQGTRQAEIGWFGSKDKYNDIIKTLTDVKKGIISDELRAAYQLGGDIGSGIPAETGSRDLNLN